MPPFDVLDLFNTRRQSDHQANGKPITSRDSDNHQARVGWRSQEIEEKQRLRHSSGHDWRLDHGSDRKDGIRHSATVSHRSRGKRDSRVEDDGIRSENPLMEMSFIAGGPVEDRSQVIAEEKKFSWGSFRLSRRQKKHASTDTQKHEYGEHRLEEHVRWSTQQLSSEIVPPPRLMDITSSADRYLLPAVEDTLSSATMSTLSQLEGRRHGITSESTFAAGEEPKSRRIKAPSEYDIPFPGISNPYKRSYRGLDSSTITDTDDVPRNPRLGRHLLSPIIGTPRSFEASLTAQHSSKEHNSHINSVTSGSRLRPPSRPLLSVGLSDDKTFSLSRSLSTQENGAYPLRRIAQRLKTTGLVRSKSSRTETTDGIAQNRKGHRQPDNTGGASLQASSSIRQKHEHRESIIMHRRAEGRMSSHHVASAAILGPIGRDFTGPDLFMDDHLQRPPVTERPYSFARSTVQSVASGEPRPENRYSLEKSILDSEPHAPSTSLMSLPTTPSGSGVADSKSYQYFPLGDMEFRLVRVLPETMSTLKCEICYRSLLDTFDYIAISYAWGDGLDTKQLVLEGTRVFVPTSLHDALRAVRRKKHEVLVWVDALCIDQQNKDERATQVRLMGHIYSRAESVAIWLGPEANESATAMQLLQQVANHAVSPQRIRSVQMYADSAALLAVFKRDYWRRLWIVQEVLLAKRKIVYCGQSVYPWEVYQNAAEAFWGKESDPHIRQGPSSFPDRSELLQLGDRSLLEIMRACRKKLSENPRDKVFGVLGLVPEVTEHNFPIDYSQSVKTVYTDVVDYLISTTDQIDVIRESIHFPLHFNTAGLPSWCPDWSHIPGVSGLGSKLGFSAAGSTKAQYRFHNERRKLEIAGIKLDGIRTTGVAVGTFCASQDYLTAFLHWRAMLLYELNIEPGKNTHPLLETFCRTLCLGQVPVDYSSATAWYDVSCHVFSSLIREKIPRILMDEDLANYADATSLIKPDARRKFLQDHFGDRMMGRSFCITDQGLLGMGSGYMTIGDLVIVPLGCSTPILLRPEGRHGEYRYVGDIYIDRYMHGEAIKEMEARNPNRVVSKYMLC